MDTAGSVLWTMLAAPDEALPLIHHAAAEAGFRAEFPDEAEVRIDVQRSLRARRRACRLTGAVSSAARGTEVVWTLDDSRSGPYEHLLGIEENLPDGLMYYHGLADAAARAGLSFGGRKALRDLVGVLEGSEVVRAVGKGHLNGKPGFVMLTGTRLVVAARSAMCLGPLLNVPHGSIEALTLGKRISGETLRLSLSGTAVEITQLGHGEGYGLATNFREVLKQRARTAPISGSDARPSGAPG